MTTRLLLTIALCIAAKTSTAAPVRRVEVFPGQVVTIRTALGQSTLLEVSGRPKSVIVGDQDAFKVEYAGDRVAIKPLLAGARTNLFVTTAYEDFQILLTTSEAKDADFLVKIASKGRTPSEGARPYQPPAICLPSDAKEGVQLAVHSLSRQANVLRVAFSLRKQGFDASQLGFEPDHVFLTTKTQNRVIDALSLERLTVENQPLLASLDASTAGLGRKEALRLQFKHPSLRRSLEVELRWNDLRCLREGG